jgi:hypothetical protein
MDGAQELKGGNFPTRRISPKDEAERKGGKSRIAGNLKHPNKLGNSFISLISDA